MGYYEFKVSVSDKSKDALLHKMTDMGCLGVTEKSDGVIAFFRDGLDVVALRNELTSFRRVLKESGLDDTFSFDYQYLSERDWNEPWKKRFVPIDVGENLSILPPWERRNNGRIPLIIDPGMAFGTGHHETTKTCLMMIERLAPETGYGRFLDVGTGTGILAIAASRLGFRHVIGVDIDPLAVDAASRNAQLNSLSNIHIKPGEISAVDGHFDLVAANLMSEVLIGIAPDIASHLENRGIVILSGILVGQEGDVIKAMNKSGLDMTENIIDGRWVSLVAKHSANVT